MANAWKAAKRHEKEPRMTAQTEERDDNSAQQKPQYGHMARDGDASQNPSFAKDEIGSQYQNNNIPGGNQFLGSYNTNNSGEIGTGESIYKNLDNSGLSDQNPYHQPQVNPIGTPNAPKPRPPKINREMRT